MDSSTLVESQIEEGRRLLERLSRAGFEVAAALWLKEDGTWRFFIASSAFDRSYKEAVRLIHDVYTKTQDHRWLKLTDLRLIGTNDSRAKEAAVLLKQYQAFTPSAYQGSQIGDRSIEGYYLYEPATIS